MKHLAIVAIAFAAVIAAAGCQTMTGRTVGQGVDDAKVTAEVKAKLAADRLANLTQVNVDTVRGIVYLMGVVPTVEDKSEAERTARSVNGVHSVVNHLMVQSAATQPRTTSAAASPATTAPGPALTGEVTNVDHATGVLTVSTKDGAFDLHFPPAQVRDIKRGDHVRVDVGLQPLTR